MAEQALLGAHFATPFAFDGGWPYQLDIYRAGRFPAAKVMLPKGFGWMPEHVEELIAAGAREIILRTEDGSYTPQEVYVDYVGRGFQRLVDAHPGVMFFLELGNEQNLARDWRGNPAPLPPWEGRFWQLRTRHDLRSLERPNLRWLASLPTDIEEVKVYLAETEEDFIEGPARLADQFDGFGAHIYGHFSLGYDTAERGPGGAAGWLDILTLLEAHSERPTYITEFGINHVFDEPDEKARRYRHFLNSLDPRRYPAAYVYWVGSGERHPSYQVTGRMARWLASYHAAPPEPEPEPEPPKPASQAEAVRQLQAWAATWDPDFTPVDFTEEE